MALLCSLKRTAAFSKGELEAWHKALACYRAKTINAAVLEVSSQSAKFPDFADVLQVCRRIEPPERPYNPLGRRKEIQELADRLGVEV